MAQPAASHTCRAHDGRTSERRPTTLMCIAAPELYVSQAAPTARAKPAAHASSSKSGEHVRAASTRRRSARCVAGRRIPAVPNDRASAPPRTAGGTRATTTARRARAAGARRRSRRGHTKSVRARRLLQAPTAWRADCSRAPRQVNSVQSEAMLRGGAVGERVRAGVSGPGGGASVGALPNLNGKASHGAQIHPNPLEV